MKLSLEVWKQSATERSYLPQDDVVFNDRTTPITWFEGKQAEDLHLDEQEEDFVLGLFSISALKAATLYPGCLNVVVDAPNIWPEVEPAVIDVIAQHTGAEEVITFDSPQNLD